MERRRIDHIDISFEVELVGNQLAQWAAIAIFHPSVSADKAERPGWLQQIQRALDERNVYIGAVKHGRVACSIFSNEGVRY